jgi:ssDNA-binding Zn-finger/Zn-ribbon topoisomerase 1
MAQRQKVRCPECGAEMNFHAEKLDLIRALDDPAATDPELGGVVVQFHACPACKFVLQRRAR